MKTYIFLDRDGSQGELLAVVNLEVVPGGTYVIEGVSYTLTSKPTFIIAKGTPDAGGWPMHRLEEVVLLVSKVPDHTSEPI